MFIAEWTRSQRKYCAQESGQQPKGEGHTWSEML